MSESDTILAKIYMPAGLIDPAAWAYHHMKLPIQIFTKDKRSTLAMQSLQAHIPNVKFDEVALEEDIRTGNWLLRVRKADRVLALPVDPETFPELKPEEFALLVLFAG